MHSGHTHLPPNPQVGNGPEELRHPQERVETGPHSFVHGNVSTPHQPSQPATNLRYASNEAAGGAPSSQVRPEPSLASYEQQPSAEVFPNSLECKENNRSRELGLHQRQAAPAPFFHTVEGNPAMLSLERRSAEVHPPLNAHPHPALSSASAALCSASAQNHHAPVLYHQLGNERRFSNVVWQPPAVGSPVLNRKQAQMAAGDIRENYHSINEPVTIPVTALPPNSAHRNQQPREEERSEEGNRSLSGQELAQCSDTQTSIPNLYPSLHSLGSSSSSEDENRRVTRSRKRKKVNSNQQNAEAPPKRSKTEPIAPKKETGLLESGWNKLTGWLRRKEEKSDTEQQNSMPVNMERQDDEEYHSCEEGGGKGASI